MPSIDDATMHLHGKYRDILFGEDGAVQWDSGVRSNQIVLDCRVLLAGFMRGAPTTALGIQGIRVGVGDAGWDVAPIAPVETQTALVDTHSYLFPRASLVFQYIDPGTGNPTAVPKRILQIKATLGPGIPTWPDANHATATLREFGLVATLNGVEVLVNSIRHAAITKDPVSTLERTVWLVF